MRPGGPGMSDVRSTLTLATKVQFLPGVGPERAERYRRLGLKTAGDVLFLFPRDYDRPPPDRPIDSLREGEPASVVGTISDAELASRSPGRSIFAAIVENQTGAVRIVFFNQPFRSDQITFGQRVQICGIPRLKGLRMEFVHPQLKQLADDEQGSAAAIHPIYPLTEGLRQIDVRRLTRLVVDTLAGTLTEVIPESLRGQAAEALRSGGQEIEGALPSIDVALRSIHYPQSEPLLHAARLRLIFQELLVMQLALAIRRRRLTTELRAPPLPPSALINARILNRFPFELTGDQIRAIEQIGRDMSRQFPMNRLLQGDVGSGKTVVAVYAMMLAVAHGYQAVLMAPTEILARQHLATLTQTLAESRVRIGLLCGTLTAAQRRDVLRATAAGEIDLLVGTQSLLNRELDLCRLGLCVIDEQHKFGVRQRVSLRGGGGDPHCLVMSATPIPRSIAMTLFGDVDLTTLREQPPGRGEVKTYLAHDGWKERWWAFVRARLDEGRQAYVVAPRVAAGETTQVTAVEATQVRPGKSQELPEPVVPVKAAGQSGEAAGEPDEAVREPDENVTSVLRTFRELSQSQLSGYRVGLLHGRMRGEEKRSVMEAFQDGELQVLVSTTVIEVGIDVPNATVMTILGANRFGLAQLHQLRGRVSRGKNTGHVCVFTDGEGLPEDHQRLQVFEQTGDGFALAEADFRLRGPGELLGNRQSGLPAMRIADLVRDEAVLVVAREFAQEMVDADPLLAADELAELRRQVLRRYEKRLDLGDVA